MAKFQGRGSQQTPQEIRKISYTAPAYVFNIALNILQTSRAPNVRKMQHHNQLVFAVNRYNKHPLILTMRHIVTNFKRICVMALQSCDKLQAECNIIFQNFKSMFLFLQFQGGLGCFSLENPSNKFRNFEEGYLEIGLQLKKPSKFKYFQSMER